MHDGYNNGKQDLQYLFGGWYADNDDYDNDYAGEDKNDLQKSLVNGTLDKDPACAEANLSLVEEGRPDIRIIRTQDDEQDPDHRHRVYYHHHFHALSKIDDFFEIF